MNPNIRVKVKEEIEKMVMARIIKPIEEYEWVNPMAISIKKDGLTRICLDYRELNASCVIDPLPTLFIEEILEGVEGCEIYSFNDGSTFSWSHIMHA